MINRKDFSTALYSLCKAKGYSFTIIFTFGITLGALVAMFNLNYQILAAPLPYPHEDRLVKIFSERLHNNQVEENKTAPYPFWYELYNRQDAFFEQKALINFTMSVERRLPDSPTLTTANSTPEFLNMLNAPMAMGRRFNADEGLYSMSPVAIISYHTWQTTFSADPDILNKTINIMEVDFKIIGVLAQKFIEPNVYRAGWKTDLWLPFDYDDMPPPYRKRWDTNFTSTIVVGLRNENYLNTKVEHLLSTWAATRYKEETFSFPDFKNSDIRLFVKPLKQAIVGEASKQSILMLAAAWVLVLIAAATITNLILARAATQQRTQSIQVALGAQPRHIFSGVFHELLSLMLAAALLALAVAVGILALVKQLAVGLLPRLQELQLDTITVIFTLLFALSMAVIFAVIVSHQINYRKLNSLLQSGGKGVGLQISARVRKLLIVSQVTLTGILLAGSLGVLQQALQQLRQPTGINSADQYQVRISVATLWASTSREERSNYFHQIAQELTKSPRVIAVGITSNSPVDFFTPGYEFIRTEFGPAEKISALRSLSNESFFKIVQIPLKAGRYFTDEEARANMPFMLINETLAQQLFSSAEAEEKSYASLLGKVLYRSQDDATGYTIVGVLQDLRLPGVVEMPRFYKAEIGDGVELVVQVKPGQVLAPRDINRISTAINPQLKVFDMRTAEYSLSLLTAPYKTAAWLTAALALLALLLAAIGIYGLLSYSVQLRKFELGIRMALGARPVNVLAQILKDNLVPVCVGLLLALMTVSILSLLLEKSDYSFSATLNLSPSLIGYMLPILFILMLTAATSLLAVWNIIRKPAQFMLSGK